MGRAIFNPTILDYKTAPVPEDQLRKVFKKYGTNNDNLLSKEELKKAFEYLGWMSLSNTLCGSELALRRRNP